LRGIIILDGFAFSGIFLADIVAAAGLSQSNAGERFSVERFAALESRVAELSAAIEAESARSARLIQAAAGYERQRLLQALHDTVCQGLSGVSMEAAVLVRKLEAQGSDCAPTGQVLRDMIRQTTDELHDIVRSLRQGLEEPATPDLRRAAKTPMESGVPSSQ
jgi:signal transduction histidine kinase